MKSVYVPLTFDERKYKLKQKFEVLSDDDLTYEEGKIQEMFNRLLAKLGKSKEEMHKIIIAL
jgi:uncharacterized protein YjbJ (UPF0337 family)